MKCRICAGAGSRELLCYGEYVTSECRQCRGTGYRSWLVGRPRSSSSFGAFEWAICVAAGVGAWWVLGPAGIAVTVSGWVGLVLCYGPRD